MPRVAKPKVVAAPVVKRKPAAGRKKDEHVMPEPVREGEIITDLSKTEWKVGPTIGKGGFGQIYTACKASNQSKKVSDYEYVVKIEPHANGTLFVEMHFYMRNARLEDIKQFMKTNSLKSLGMPHLVASGSHDINNQKHRFLIMPRYGSDIWKFFLENGKKIPEHTVYRIALQMLDVYKYIHGRTYIHADLKGANILLGYGKGGAGQTYLVDFGLASHYTQKEFKPDPKKMHNGTIEYTSRDAHLGVATMRSDFEILGYNIIHWSGVMLPWEKEKLLATPVKVQKSKETFMSDVSGNLKKLYPKGVPNPIAEFMKYVATLEYNDTPDYSKCRGMFLAGLKALKMPDSGDLDFKLKSTPNAKLNSHTKEAAGDASDEDDDDEQVFEKKTPVKASRRRSPQKPVKTIPASPKVRLPRIVSPNVKINTPAARTPRSSPKRKPKASPRVAATSRNVPVSAEINFSPVVSIRKTASTPNSSGKQGNTITNVNVTPNPHSKKTYEFNFELDVSMDANVIVNVKRKRKPKQDSTESPARNGHSNTPETKVKVRRLVTKSSATKKKRTDDSD